MSNTMSLDTIKNNKINVETYGSGDRKVVALHCALGRAASWKQYGAMFNSEITLKAPDWPGHGKSAPWQDTGLMRMTARDIVAELVGDEPVDLVGHSYGGMVALEYAARNPEKVRSLTLIEPIYLAVAGEDDRPVLDDYLAQMQPHFDALAEGRNKEAAEIFMDIWGGGTRLADLPEPAQVGLSHQIPVVDACKPGDETGVEERDTLARLSSLDMPMTMIYGEKTLPVVKTVMTGLKARMPHAALVEVADAAHMAPMTHSKEISEQLQALWASDVA